MKLNATPETIRAVNAAFELAALLDDRITAGDKARIALAAEKAQTYQLTEDDLLDGVQSYYDAMRDRAMQVADLIACARSAHQDRVDRQPITEVRSAAFLELGGTTIPCTVDGCNTHASGEFSDVCARHYCVLGMWRTGAGPLTDTAAQVLS